MEINIKSSVKNSKPRRTPRVRQGRGPGWAWWGRGAPDLNPRHAVRLLSRAGGFEVLVYEGGPPLDRALQAYLRARRSMGRNDRAVVSEAVYHLARNRAVIARAMDDEPPGEGGRLLLAFLDLLGTDEPGKVPHLPGGVGRWARALRRVEELRAGWIGTLKRAWKAPAREGGAVREALEGLFSVPGWWLDRGPWQTVGEAVRELARLRRPQSLCLRVQVHRASRDDVILELRERGVPARPTERSPWGVRVEGRHNVMALPVIREGRAEVQDEGSQLVACLCDPKPGERVLDLCAGGGGKTLALASAMGGRGLVVAHDADARRLADTRRRARRAGLGNIRVVPDPPRVQDLGPYDLVLADAPCTSTGTLRRNPDVAWRWGPGDLERLAALQAEILERAAGLLAPGGHLVYATCSLLEPENHEQIRELLERHPELEPAPPGDRTGHAPFADVPGAGSGAFRLPAVLPRYAGDAFFVARVRRRPAPGK